MVVFVQTSLILLAAYGVMGLIFALAFHWCGLPAVDANTRGAGVGFRWIITPGIVALWPLLAWRWRAACGRGSFPGGPDSPFPARRLRATHALAWKVLAVTTPLIVGAALWWRPTEAPRSRIPPPSPSPTSAAGSLRPAPQNLQTNRVHHAAVY